MVYLKGYKIFSLNTYFDNKLVLSHRMNQGWAASEHAKQSDSLEHTNRPAACDGVSLPISDINPQFEISLNKAK